MSRVLLPYIKIKRQYRLRKWPSLEGMESTVVLWRTLNFILSIRTIGYFTANVQTLPSCNVISDTGSFFEMKIETASSLIGPRSIVRCWITMQFIGQVDCAFLKRKVLGYFFLRCTVREISIVSKMANPVREHDQVGGAKRASDWVLRFNGYLGNCIS